jgi:predicted dehydrogenase
MLSIGILGAARIAPDAVIRPAALLPDVEVAAVAASTIKKAQAFASKHDIPGVSASYADLVSSPDIDAIYNALPPNLHEQWSVAALRAGKHVLCEKPFAMNATQALRMVQAANDSQRILIEAFHYRFHPYFHRVLKLLTDDTVGDIRHIAAQFDVRIPDRPSEFRHDPALGGGALMDLGCYPAHWVRTLMGTEPQVVRAECMRSAAGVDVATRASLRFPSGATAEVTSAMDETAAEQHCARVVIEGEKGRMTLENPIAPHNGNKIIVEAKEISFDEAVVDESTYFHQLVHFLATVEGSKTTLTGGDDAVNNMHLIDAIYAAAGFQRPDFA